jgi:hypothetical protein
VCFSECAFLFTVFPECGMGYVSYYLFLNVTKE